jgi:nucleotide-binding universal stress UspA family protein
MKPSLVVLTDFSLAAERARAYATALAVALGAELHLVHVFLPLPVEAEYGLVVPAIDARYVPETRRHLQQVAQALPVPATADLLEADWYEAIEQAIQHYQPVLLVAGLTSTQGWLDEWLSNRTLPLAHETGYPVLLVPENLPDTALHPPRCLALAVEDKPFELTAADRAAAPLFDKLGCDIVPVTVLDPAHSAGGWDGLHAAQQCGLAGRLAHCTLHKVVSDDPAAGVLQAVYDLDADLLGLLDQGHGWVHKLISGSVIDHVLRHTPVPVLLLSVHEAPPRYPVD